MNLSPDVELEKELNEELTRRISLVEIATKYQQEAERNTKPVTNQNRYEALINVEEKEQEENNSKDDESSQES